MARNQQNLRVRTPSEAESKMFDDVWEQITPRWEENYSRWRDIMPDQYPRFHSKSEEAEYLEKFYDTREGKDQDYRFAKTVWHAIAGYNYEVRLPLVVRDWFEKPNNKKKLGNKSETQKLLRVDAKIESLFDEKDIHIYGIKFLDAAVKRVQWHVSNPEHPPEMYTRAPLIASSHLQSGLEAGTISEAERSANATTEDSREISQMVVTSPAISISTSVESSTSTDNVTAVDHQPGGPVDGLSVAQTKHDNDPSLYRNASYLHSEQPHHGSEADQTKKEAVLPSSPVIVSSQLHGRHPRPAPEQFPSVAMPGQNEHHQEKPIPPFSHAKSMPLPNPKVARRLTDFTPADTSGRSVRPSKDSPAMSHYTASPVPHAVGTSPPYTATIFATNPYNGSAYPLVFGGPSPSAQYTYGGIYGHDPSPPTIVSSSPKPYTSSHRGSAHYVVPHTNDYTPTFEQVPLIDRSNHQSFRPSSTAKSTQQKGRWAQHHEQPWRELPPHFAYNAQTGAERKEAYDSFIDRQRTIHGGHEMSYQHHLPSNASMSYYQHGPDTSPLTYPQQVASRHRNPSSSSYSGGRYPSGHLEMTEPHVSFVNGNRKRADSQPYQQRREYMSEVEKNAKSMSLCIQGCGRTHVANCCADATKLFVTNVIEDVPDHQVSDYFKTFGSLVDFRRVPPLHGADNKAARYIVRFSASDVVQACIDDRQRPPYLGNIKVELSRDHWDPHFVSKRQSKPGTQNFVQSRSEKGYGGAAALSGDVRNFLKQSNGAVAVSSANTYDHATASSSDALASGHQSSSIAATAKKKPGAMSRSNYTRSLLSEDDPGAKDDAVAGAEHSTTSLQPRSVPPEGPCIVVGTISRPNDPAIMHEKPSLGTTADEPVDTPALLLAEPVIHDYSHDISLAHADKTEGSPVRASSDSIQNADEPRGSENRNSEFVATANNSEESFGVQPLADPGQTSASDELLVTTLILDVIARVKADGSSASVNKPSCKSEEHSDDEQTQCLARHAELSAVQGDEAVGLDEATVTSNKSHGHSAGSDESITKRVDGPTIIRQPQAVEQVAPVTTKKDKPKGPAQTQSLNPFAKSKEKKVKRQAKLKGSMKSKSKAIDDVVRGLSASSADAADVNERETMHAAHDRDLHPDAGEAKETISRSESLSRSKPRPEAPESQTLIGRLKDLVRLSSPTREVQPLASKSDTNNSIPPQTTNDPGENSRTNVRSKAGNIVNAGVTANDHSTFTQIDPLHASASSKEPQNSKEAKSGKKHKRSSPSATDPRTRSRDETLTQSVPNATLENSSITSNAHFSSSNTSPCTSQNPSPIAKLIKAKTASTSSILQPVSARWKHIRKRRPNDNNAIETPDSADTGSGGSVSNISTHARTSPDADPGTSMDALLDAIRAGTHAPLYVSQEGKTWRTVIRKSDGSVLDQQDRTECASTDSGVTAGRDGESIDVLQQQQNSDQAQITDPKYMVVKVDGETRLLRRNPPSGVQPDTGDDNHELEEVVEKLREQEKLQEQ